MPQPLDLDRQALAVSFIADAERMALAYYRRFCRDIDRDELTAEAIAGLVYAASMYDASRGIPFKNYATMVIHHHMARMATRWRKWHRVSVVGVLNRVADDNPFNPIDPLTIAEAIEQLQATLPAKWFEVLYHRHAEELTYREIGERGGYSHQNAAQLVERAETMARSVA